VLSKALESKKDELSGERRILHNEECIGLYGSPPSSVMMAKLRRLQWAKHLARTGTKNECRILVGNLLGKCLLGRR
jgi:hypothetical protein